MAANPSTSVAKNRNGEGGGGIKENIEAKWKN